jgi:hypothetical protein
MSKTRDPPRRRPHAPPPTLGTGLDLCKFQHLCCSLCNFEEVKIIDAGTEEGSNANSDTMVKLKLFLECGAVVGGVYSKDSGKE